MKYTSNRLIRHFIVTTRTTTLTTVQHARFTLRFSNLSEIEVACKEDEEQRAGRFIDWISSRVGRSCSRWVDEVERREGEAGADDRTVADEAPEPWWEDLRRCAEGDHVPCRAEGWNHPTSSMYTLEPSVHKVLTL